MHVQWGYDGLCIPASRYSTIALIQACDASFKADVPTTAPTIPLIYNTYKLKFVVGHARSIKLSTRIEKQNRKLGAGQYRERIATHSLQNR